MFARLEYRQFYKFFSKNLNIDNNTYDDVLVPDFPEVNIGNELDADITSDKIMKAIFNLKRRKM